MGSLRYFHAAAFEGRGCFCLQGILLHLFLPELGSCRHSWNDCFSGEVRGTGSGSGVWFCRVAAVCTVFTQRPVLLPGAVAGWLTMPLPASQWVSTDLSPMVPIRFCLSRLTDSHGFMLPFGPCFDRMEAEHLGLGQREGQPVGSLGVGGQEAHWFALSGTGALQMPQTTALP